MDNGNNPPSNQKTTPKSNKKPWNLAKEGSSSIKTHKTFGSFYKSKSDGLWWSRDRAGHGGNKFKVFRETNGGLEWYKDADEFGNFIENKHKGDVGKFISWSELTTFF